ncbi:Uncharacterised protein [Mycobacterium tuberculosis]|uniref:Uncharacterized protein n=1 Tax=Mycobacterium tuberculosis TaxID=1773 RepID=A0A916P8W6_MYCTX|nr:Uncharacterised protein [Mycobacterium tuberculosis]COZ16562.1 Uncharacterised protein [Mycobacterium tuberculosis]
MPRPRIVFSATMTPATTTSTTTTTKTIDRVPWTNVFRTTSLISSALVAEPNAVSPACWAAA